jgi:hypothetical protein
VLSIINGIGEYDSIIEVTNVGKFIIVNGLTSQPEVLQFQTINDHLTERFNQPFNIIDTISYGVDLESPNEMWFTFYNNQQRPSYHPKVVEYLKDNSGFNSIEYNESLSVEVDFNSGPSETKFTTLPLNISSEFPHGYSLNTGRTCQVQSGKHVCKKKHPKCSLIRRTTNGNIGRHLCKQKRSRRIVVSRRRRIRISRRIIKQV